MKEPKTIFITGCSTGIGKELAVQYAGPGITLFICSRNREKLAQVSNICAERGADVHYRAIDVTDADRLKQWISECDCQAPVELVIANAGISGGTSGTVETEQQTRKIFAVNVDGVLNTILPFIPLMQQRKRGQIAIISSLASYRGIPGAPAYSASKAAVRIYAEALRGSLHQYGIGVTVVTPGYIKTPMTDANDFPMPMMMELEKAAALIRKKLRKNPSRLAFPYPMYFIVWILGCLPPWLTDPFFRRLPAKKSGS